MAFWEIRKALWGMVGAHVICCSTVAADVQTNGRSVIIYANQEVSS